MSSKFERWAARHMCFDSVLKIDPLVQAVNRAQLTVRYFFFTRGKQGSFLRGTLKPTAQQIIENSFFGSIRYLLILLVVALLPEILPMHLQPLTRFDGDYNIVAGFMTAVLAIAGIFLTLFYTSALAVLSNKYPGDTGAVSQLFVKSMLSNKELRYCNSFVVVTIVAFILAMFRLVNNLAIFLMAVLSIILIVKLPRVLKLSTKAADISTIATIPANRFLALAQAASYKYSFHGSAWLTENFNKLAEREISMLGLLMDYALNSGNCKVSYSRTIAEVSLETLVKYSRISTTIPIDSQWHLRSAEHKSWFMSNSSEVQIAINAGTIPFPKSEPNLTGFHEQLFLIASSYQNAILRERNFDELENWLMYVQIFLEFATKAGNAAFVVNRILSSVVKTLDAILELKTTDNNDVQKKCRLIEICASNFSVIAIELIKLFSKTNTEKFAFGEFESFSQQELQTKGFPLGLNSELASLCKKINYEILIFDCVKTPAWYFNEAVSRVGIKVLDGQSGCALSAYEEFSRRIANALEKDPPSCFILALKETELFRKIECCLDSIEEYSLRAFGDSSLVSEYRARIAEIHRGVTSKYPGIAIKFHQRDEESNDIFPDMYGFIFFNYCEQLYSLIIARKLGEFASAIPSLLQLLSLAQDALQQEVSAKQLNDVYKAQVLVEPAIIFYELCGMAYCMSELLEDFESQLLIKSQINSILRDFPDMLPKWEAHLELSLDFNFNSKSFMDLFNWRRMFMDTVSEEGLYPDIPPYPFGRINWEPTPREKRIIKMLPVDFREYRSFDGCKVFKEFLLPEAVCNHE